MAVHHIGTLKYHTFGSFDDLAVEHALITRHGGVSSEPWATLNIASTVGDNKDHVVENLNRVFQTFNIDRNNTYDVWQIHSNRVVCTSSPRKENVLHQQADAILTDQQGLALFMRFADCVPILLFDPHKKVVGIAHAGWKGTISKIVFNAVQTMSKQYGSIHLISSRIVPSVPAIIMKLGRRYSRDTK
jgi:YfiH family protein